MMQPPLIRIHPAATKTATRILVSEIGQVYTAKAGGTRMMEMRHSQQVAPGQYAQPGAEVTDTLKDFEDAWPGFARLRKPLNDGGLEFLLNVESIIDYTVVQTHDTQSKQPAGEAIAVRLGGRAEAILVGMRWGEADEKIMAARQRIDDLMSGKADLPEEAPDAGLTLA